MSDRRDLDRVLTDMGAAPTTPPDPIFVRALEERLIAADMSIESSARIPFARRRSVRVVALLAGLFVASSAAAVVGPPVVRKLRHVLHLGAASPSDTSVGPTLAAPTAVASFAIDGDLEISKTIPGVIVPADSLPSPGTSTTRVVAVVPVVSSTSSTTLPAEVVPSSSTGLLSEPTTGRGPTSTVTAPTTSAPTTSAPTTSAPTTSASTSTTPDSTTSTEPRIVVPPMDLLCQKVSGPGVRCTWSAAPAGTTIRILRGTPGATVGRVFVPTPGSTSYLDATATSGTYGYRIQAVASDGHVVAQSAYVTVVV